MFEDNAQRGYAAIPKKAGDTTGASVGQVKKEVSDTSANSGKLVPGTPEHKNQRWEDYQARGGTWSQERWSKQYDTNMQNATHGIDVEEKYRQEFGGESRIIKTPLTNRQIDIYREEDLYCGQLKTGKVYLTDENKLAIAKDSTLVDKGYTVEHILEKGASKNYLDALSKANIPYKIGSQLK
jgi:hypothetical protein